MCLLLGGKVPGLLAYSARNVEENWFDLNTEMDELEKSLIPFLGGCNLQATY